MVFYKVIHPRIQPKQLPRIIIQFLRETIGSLTMCQTCRLYRAQRLYVQLLPKSMFLAILIDNGIRLQSTITLCPEKVFSCHILQDTKVVCPFLENPASTKVVDLCAQFCALRESADLLLFVT